MSTETWRPVVGHAPYEVSDYGNLRNGRTGLVLAGGKNRKGYRSARLHGDHPTTKTFHAMVAEAFIGPRPTGQQVRHRDGDNLNNAVANLVYGTNGDNQLDSVNHGTHHKARRTVCPANHPYSGVNSEGKRICRICMNKRDRDRRARKTAERLAEV